MNRPDDLPPLSTPLRLAVRDVASKTLHSVSSATPIHEIENLLEDHDVSAAPVIDDGALVGIVSSTDLLRAARRAIAARPGAPDTGPPPRTARDLMQPNVAWIDEDEPLVDAARTMIARRIHRLVVTRGGRPVGVVSTRDAMRAVLRMRVATPLADVMSTPVEAIDIGDPIRVAVARLEEANVRGLVVVDGDWPVGVFTHREAIRARSLPPELCERPVEEVMSYSTMCFDVSTPLYRVAGHAVETRIRRVLAVENRMLRGIATGFDLVRVLVEEAK